MVYEPVGPFAAAFDIETACESAAFFKDAVSFPIGRFFVRESVEAVKGQHDVEALIFEGQFTHVSLHERNVTDPEGPDPLPGGIHHVRGIIETSDVSFRKFSVNRHCKHTCPHRHLQELAAEIEAKINEAIQAEIEERNNPTDKKEAEVPAPQVPATKAGARAKLDIVVDEDE